MSVVKTSVPKVIGRFTLSYAAVVAAIIEAALLTALVIGLAHKQVAVRAAQAAVMLSFPIIAETPPPKPQAKPTPKPPIQKPKPRPKPKPIHHVVKPRAVPKPPPPKQVAVTTPDPPKTVPVPQTAPPRPSVSPDVMSLFEQQVHEAIQAVLVYPYAAKLAHIQGRVQVSFSYRDGRVSDIKIIRTSDYGMFNTAAQQAVLSASYPSPPAALAGRALQFEVWVRFDQVSTYAQ
jgi:protein TonB